MLLCSVQVTELNMILKKWICIRIFFLQTLSLVIFSSFPEQYSVLTGPLFWVAVVLMVAVLSRDLKDPGSILDVNMLKRASYSTLSLDENVNALHNCLCISL